MAKRIHYSKGDETQRVSPPAIRIATAGIAIGVMVMLLTVAIVVGFKEEVRQRLVDFGGHLQLQAWSPNNTYELPAIRVDSVLTQRLSQCADVKRVVGVVTKPAVLKTDSDFISVIIKGQSAPLPLAEDDSTALGEREVALSRAIADKLLLDVGDDVTAYFVQNSLADDALAMDAANAKVKSRRLTVGRIYETHFSEIDQQMVLASPAMLQQVSEWDEDMYSSLSIWLGDYDHLDEAVWDMTQQKLTDAEETPLLALSVAQQNPQVFAWLELIDTNVWIILILMAVVASFTMISGLLIIILERARMIGILKAQGLDNGRLRRMFLWVALFLTGQGMLWGNVLSLALCFIQQHWHIIRLDPKDYYLEWVPIHLTWPMWALVNVGTVLVTLLVLLGPSALVARVSPAKVLAGES